MSEKNCEHDLVRFAISAAQVIKEVMDQVRIVKSSSPVSATLLPYHSSSRKRSHSKSLIRTKLAKRFKTSKAAKSTLLSSLAQHQTNHLVSFFPISLHDEAHSRHFQNAEF